MFAGGGCGTAPIVVIDSAQTFQTIEGWDTAASSGRDCRGYNLLGPAIADPVNYQYLDYLVDNLGLTGTRPWEVGPRIDGTGNDNGDCDIVDWNLFEGDTLHPWDAGLLGLFPKSNLAKGIRRPFTRAWISDGRIRPKALGK